MNLAHLIIIFKITSRISNSENHFMHPIRKLMVVEGKFPVIDSSNSVTLAFIKTSLSKRRVDRYYDITKPNMSASHALTVNLNFP